MQKILTLIISIAIIYMIFKHNIDDIKVPVVEMNDKNKPDTSSSATQVPPDMTGNFVEKTISNVLVNVLKTDEGRMFLKIFCTL
jgi:hypothetical protein